MIKAVLVVVIVGWLVYAAARRLSGWILPRQVVEKFDRSVNTFVETLFRICLAVLVCAVLWAIYITVR